MSDPIATTQTPADRISAFITRIITSRPNWTQRDHSMLVAGLCTEAFGVRTWDAAAKLPAPKLDKGFKRAARLLKSGFDGYPF